MKTLNLLVPDQIYQTACELAEVKDADVGQFCLATLSDGLNEMLKYKSVSQHLPSSTARPVKDLPDTVTQVFEVCRCVWQERKSLTEALRTTKDKVSVLESTVRDKCTRRINLSSISDFSELLAVPNNLIDHLCVKYQAKQAEIRRLFGTILPVRGSDSDRMYVPQTPPPRGITEMDLVNAIIACLKRHGGKLDKPDVEREVFETFKEQFQHPWYQEPGRGGVPRWRKNVQFAEGLQAQGIDCGPETIACCLNWKKKQSSFMMWAIEKTFMNSVAVARLKTGKNWTLLDKQVAQARSLLRQMQETIEDIEDARIIERAKAAHGNKPRIPWSQVKKDLKLD